MHPDSESNKIIIIQRKIGKKGKSHENLRGSATSEFRKNLYETKCPPLDFVENKITQAFALLKQLNNYTDMLPRTGPRLRLSRVTCHIC